MVIGMSLFVEDSSSLPSEHVPHAVPSSFFVVQRLCLNFSAALCILHFIGKNSNFSRMSWKKTHSIEMIAYKRNVAATDIHTWISSVAMYSTEQWVFAMKSAFTPYAPAHRGSPTMLLAPIESLHGIIDGISLTIATSYVKLNVSRSFIAHSRVNWQ